MNTGDRKFHHVLMTGLIAGTLLAATDNLHSPLNGAHVEPLRDDNGDYTHVIELTTASGRVYRLAVLDDYSVQEEIDST